ncbi:MAG: sigma 54-interacting transcriptional regulator, partial [Desulfobacterales bacterium]
ELKTVFDNLPEGVVGILDVDLNIATANNAFSKMLKLPPNNIVGQKATKLFRKKVPDLIELLKETIQTRKGIRNYTMEIVSTSGETKSYLVSTAIIEEMRGRETGVVLILHDISELTRLRKLGLQMDRYGELIGKSEKMKTIYGLIETIKNYNSSILIVGETGTGKELVARTIHNMSDRKNKPFVPVNCSAIPESLIESELFGYVKGAFTGADSNRAGRFCLADGGTLLLDEVGTLNMNVQTKLLRVLQEKIVEPLGSSERIPVDVRILSATNRDAAELVAKGKLREDLYYRLKVIQINLPPLRDKKDDIPILTDFFITRLNRYYRKNIAGISPDAKELLQNYPWPGNVRELENAIEQAFILADRNLLETKHFPFEIRRTAEDGIPPPPAEGSPRAEEELIRKALLAAMGNKGDAAEMLGMHRSSLWRKMREFRIDKSFGKKR